MENAFSAIEEGNCKRKPHAGLVKWGGVYVWSERIGEKGA